MSSTTIETSESAGGAPRGAALGRAVARLLARAALRVTLRVASLPGLLIARLTHRERSTFALEAPRTDSRAERARIRAEIAGSHEANAWLSLEKGLRSHYSADGVATWASSGSTAMIVGGMHGVRPARHARRFVEDAASAGYRRVMLFPVGPQQEATARQAGFELACCGSETIVELATFTLQGRRFADLRQMRNRAQRRYGLEVIELRGEALAAARSELLDDYAEWRRARRQPHPMRLLVGSTGWQTPELFDDALAAGEHGRRVFAARYPSKRGASSHAGRDTLGEYAAFATFVPADQGRTWGLDVMSRPQSAPAGTMELLVSEAMRRFADEGALRVSLGANPMAVARVSGPADGPGWLQPFFAWLYASRPGNALFNFENLHRFKQKFGGVDHAVSFAIWPRVTPWALYVGCGMWGLFGPSWASPRSDDDLQLRREAPTKAAS